MSVERYANSYTTTLTNSMTSGQLTMPASGAAPATLQGGQFRMALDSEIVLVTLATSSTWTIVRGMEGTAPATHAQGVIATHVVTQSSIRLTNFVNVMAQGINGDGTEETTALVAAMADGGGRTLYFPDPPVEYKTTLPLPVESSTTLLSEQATIYQAGSNKPVFDLVDKDDVKVQGFYLRTDREAWSATSFRSDSVSAYKSGIWAAGDRITIRDVRTKNFCAGVYLVNWDAGSGTKTGFHTDCIVDGLRVDTCDWGVLGLGQDTALIHNVTGTYALSSGSPNPPHLIYWTGNPGDSVNVEISDCVARDSTGTDAYAYQFKGITGGRMSNLISRACSGVLSIANCAEVHVSGVVSINDQITSENGSVFLQSVSGRVILSDLRLQLAAAHRAVRLDGIDSSLVDTYISVLATGPAAELIAVNGTRSIVDQVKIRNAAAATTTLISVFSGTDHVIRNVELDTATTGITVFAGVTGVTLDYDPALITGVTTVANLAETTTRVLRRPTRVAYVQNGGTIATDASAMTDVYISTTGNAALTISNPTQRTAGMDLTYTISNDSGGAMGATTWGTNFDLATAWTNPANAKWATVRFVWNGSKWREQSRVLAT